MEKKRREVPVEAMTYEEIEANILRSMDALGTKPEDYAEMIQRVLAKKAQQRAECGESSKVSRLDIQDIKQGTARGKKGKQKENEMWGLKNDEGPFLKVGSKA